LSGRKYGSKYNNGDIVTFECDPEFVLKGSAVRKCLENGTWNGTEAICTGNSDKTTGYRGINLNANGGLDLVFVIQASSSVKKGTDFKSGLEFAKELVRTIGASKRYGPMTHCSQSVVLVSRVLNCIQGIERPFKVFVSLQGYVHCLQS